MKKIIDIICQPEVVMWGLVIIIPLVSKFATGIKYISVVDIIKNHLKCFTNKDGKYLLVPIVNYVVLPFLMGAATVQIKMIDASTIEIITVIVSILTAMLFTMLTMVIDMKGKIRQNAGRNLAERKQASNRTYDSGDVRNRKKFDQGGTQYPAWHGNDRTRTGIGKLYIKKCRRVDPSDAYDDAGTWQYHEIRGL